MWLTLDLFASDKSCETSPEDDRQQQKNVDNGKVGYRLAIVFLFRDFLFYYYWTLAKYKIIADVY